MCVSARACESARACACIPFAEALGAADHVLGERVERLNRAQRLDRRPRRVLEPLDERVVDAEDGAAADEERERLEVELVVLLEDPEAQLLRRAKKACQNGCGRIRIAKSVLGNFWELSCANLNLNLNHTVAKISLCRSKSPCATYAKTV